MNASADLSSSTTTPVYGACGVQDCTRCRPLYDADNQPIPRTEQTDA